MNPTAVYTVVFSPTGTSRKIAAAVAQGVARHGGSCNATANTAAGADAGTNAAAGSAAKAFTTIDLTHAAGKPPVLPADAAAVFAVPVYGGRVAPAALERLQEIRGEGTPAVVLAVYVNRAFGTAVAQLAAFVAERGFVPVAAGAFVGEHSYSTPGTPIAEGRPDTQDLAEAAAFGARIGQKLAHGETGPIDAAKLREPHTPLLSKLRFIRFVLGYRRRQKRTPAILLPAGDAARCTQCGRCVALCPTQAIARGDELHTDPARCIRCCACVKGCAFGARTFETPFAAVLSRNFARRKPPVTLM